MLEAVIRKYPELNITALCRSPSSEFKTRYPKVNIVVGDFDDFEVIEKSSSAADVVIRKFDLRGQIETTTDLPKLIDMGDIDHPGCAAAILSGLSKKSSPSFLIHLSGTGCISDERGQTWDGKVNPHVWHDINDIREIYDLPDSARHHIIDRNIMDASDGLLSTAIICPPDIYGQNTGLGNRATFSYLNTPKFCWRERKRFTWVLGRI